jgi:hypothetical protein
VNYVVLMAIVDTLKDLLENFGSILFLKKLILDNFFEKLAALA